MTTNTALIDNVFYLQGLDCPDCSKNLKNDIEHLPQVQKAELIFSLGKLTVTHNTEMKNIIKVVEQHGCQIKRTNNITTADGAAKQKTKQQQNAECAKNVTITTKIKKILSQSKQGGLVSAIFSGTLLLLAILLQLFDFPHFIVISVYLLSIITGGWATFQRGLRSLVKLKFDINVLMVIALFGAFSLGEWQEGALIAFLFSLSNTLENYSMDKTRQSIKNLMSLVPPVATVKESCSATEKILPVEQVAVGDIIIVRPGEGISMDGQVVQGSSWVNEAPITGESALNEKKLGSTVYAGSINENGYLEIAVTKLAKDNTISKIIKLVEEALADKPPLQKFIDRFAAYYTPAILVIALGLITIPMLWGGQEFAPWLYRALALLLVACPCALIISTPVALVTAMGYGAREGVLIKGGLYLEQMSKVKTIAFDKTGTLTEGRLQVSEIKNFDGKEEIMLQAAHSLEKMSEHPLAKSLCRYAAEQGIATLPVNSFQVKLGQGVKGELIHTGKSTTTWLVGNLDFLISEGVVVDEHTENLLAEQIRKGATVVGVGLLTAQASKAQEGNLVGYISFRDKIRPEAISALQEIKKLGVNAVMLTGDNLQVAKKVGQAVGIKQILGHLLPDEKLAAIKELEEKSGRVAMLGDGINDAPALAEASVGIAMGAGGTDAALETADIALLGDDLNKLPFLITLSRKTLKIIKQNVVLSLGLKLLAITLISFGWFTLWMAVLADMGISLLVTLNALRLRQKISHIQAQ